MRPIVQVVSMNDGVVHKGDRIDMMEVTDVTIECIRYKDIDQTTMGNQEWKDE